MISGKASCVLSEAVATTWRVRLGRVRHGKPPAPRHVGDGKHMIDPACLDGAARHAVVAGFLRLLRDDEPRLLLDRFQSEAAVGAGAGQDHADRARAVVVGQRMQQEIERQSRAMPRLRGDEVQRALGDREIGARRNDVEMVALRCGMPSAACSTFIDVWLGQQLDHHAFVIRIEMLHQDEGHAASRRQGVEELPAGVEPAGRRADGDDGEAFGLAEQKIAKSTQWSAARRPAEGYLLPDADDLLAFRFALG